MKLFVSYSHTRGFGNAVIEFAPEATGVRDLDDVRYLEELIHQEKPDYVDPMILWWRELPED